LRATFAGNPERRFKFELTEALKERAAARDLSARDEKPSLLTSIKAFFRQPLYVGALATALIAVLVLAVYLSRRPSTDDLAELQQIYQQARPTESRISRFNYAPLSQLRGQADSAEMSRLRRIENNLIEAKEKTPNAGTHHALGIFYLTQQKYPDAIRELETASKFDDKNARIHNDLGAAHFELAGHLGQDKQLEELALSLEQFTRASELDGNSLEALFNKSLALQQLRMPRQAKESWLLYLKKDPSSQWADEARKRLQQIESEQRGFKGDADVLREFLASIHNQDDTRAQLLHNETKGLLKEPALALQLSKKLLLARKAGNGAEAAENLDALRYLAAYERTRHAEFFFLN
jgi:tetratricopeptide (TPR) repeat protein